MVYRLLAVLTRQNDKSALFLEGQYVILSQVVEVRQFFKNKGLIHAERLIWMDLR
ncbi:hypothetical protein VRK_36120 [Vibrio sp. MEBiC08052]|nr:hypothetical protein VRK_36120 [Vibrio sp. MEBiC08052]